jgi:hypothetical protein
MFALLSKHEGKREDRETAQYFLSAIGHAYYDHRFDRLRFRRLRGISESKWVTIVRSTERQPHPNTDVVTHPVGFTNANANAHADADTHPVRFTNSDTIAHPELLHYGWRLTGYL